MGHERTELLWICMPSFAHSLQRCLIMALLFITCAACVKAQRSDFTYKTYGLEVDADNVIENRGNLDDFFESLYQQQLLNDRKINIVHIGDSHIQADYMTSIVRRSFHSHFGNAGRGLVVPLRVARTNEPGNFKTTSKVIWNAKRCVFPEQPLAIGIGGVTIETGDAKANLEIHMNDLWLDYSFNSLTLFYEEDVHSFGFSVRGPDGRELGKIVPAAADTTRGVSHLTWEGNVTSVELRCEKTQGNGSRAALHGIVLQNSQNGILYHSIGVNGAKFKHYNEAKFFASQTSALNPDLFIISLGTNESVDYPYLDKSLPEHIDRLITTLRKHNPLAAFILVTPQDAFLKKNRLNPGIAIIRDQIIEYAVVNGLAFYDWYRAAGGENSAPAWTENALLSKDGIHLTKEGYEYQGNLFYHALMKGYNSYVPNRHP